MKKRYEIVIKETTLEEGVTQQEWVEGGTIERSTEGNYGYTPQIPTKNVVTRVVYSQNTDGLDLAAVIMAVNQPSI